MARLEFLLEEQSMATVLEILLPKILPPKWVLNYNVFLRPHEGKSDLRRSIPRKIRSFAHETQPVGIIILHDQDANDCRVLKQDLISLCHNALSGGPVSPNLIRIVCRELEAWYLGDMAAIQAAYPRFQADRHQNKAKFRIPDACNAKDELRKILREFQPISSARAIAPHLDISVNQSVSFQCFVNGLQAFAAQF